MVLGHTINDLKVWGSNYKKDNAKSNKKQIEFQEVNNIVIWIKKLCLG
jgi:hypothetical protein